MLTAGGGTIVTPGLQNSDTFWQTMGRIGVFNAAHTAGRVPTESRLLVLTAALPNKGNQRALNAVLGRLRGRCPSRRLLPIGQPLTRLGNTMPQLATQANPCRTQTRPVPRTPLLGIPDLVRMAMAMADQRNPSHAVRQPGDH